MYTQRTKQKNILPTIAILLLLIAMISLGVMLWRSQKNLEDTLLTVDNLRSEIDMLQEKVEELTTERDALQEELEKEQAYIVDLKDKLRRATSKPVPPRDKTIWLTFDDGPSGNTDRILNILAANNVKATFFVVGREGETAAARYRRIVNEGHALGNHTYSHKYKQLYASPDAMMADVNKLNAVLEKAVGMVPNIFRFPGGSSNGYLRNKHKQFTARIIEEGYQYFDWNVDSGDASTPALTTEQIIKQVKDGLQYFPYAIVLMHEKDTTVKALPEIISYAKEKNFVFATLDRDSYFNHHR